MAQTTRRTLNLINANDRIDDLLSISLHKTSTFEDSYEIIQSCSDDSLISDTQEIRPSRHYLKQSKSNRMDGHITSLKRRIRKQQLRYDQNEVGSFLLPSSTHLPTISSPRPTLTTTSATHRTKKASHAVPLPPLMTNPRIIRIRARGIRLNTGG